MKFFKCNIPFWRRPWLSILKQLSSYVEQNCCHWKWIYSTSWQKTESLRGKTWQMLFICFQQAFMTAFMTASCQGALITTSVCIAGTVCVYLLVCAKWVLVQNSRKKTERGHVQRCFNAASLTVSLHSQREALSLISHPAEAKQLLC